MAKPLGEKKHTLSPVPMAPQRSRAREGEPHRVDPQAVGGLPPDQGPGAARPAAPGRGGAQPGGPRPLEPAPRAPRQPEILPAEPRRAEPGPRPLDPLIREPRPADPRVREPRPEPRRAPPVRPQPGELRPSGEVGAHFVSAPRREAMRALDFKLLLQRGEETERQAAVIVVVSPSGGEGRSRLCADLAAVSAYGGARTLLVDGDLRSPTQHEIFGVPRERGLSEMLQVDGQPNLYRISGPRAFYLMTAGAAVGDPLERLSVPQLPEMVAEWRKQLDTIVIDTPPGSRFLDALVLSTLATQVLVLGRKDHTSTELTELLLKRLGRLGVLVDGAVLNQF